jgi:Na+/H+ antiporter NhaD/arsenite permease-like protein
MIAMRAGLTFQDFLRWASPISLGALLVTIPLSFLYYLKEIREWKRKMKGEDLGREAEFKKVI